MNSINEDILGETFNVGTGTNHSVLDLAKMIGGEYLHLPSRQGEARDTLADNSKITTALNWQPREMIEDWIYCYKKGL